MKSITNEQIVDIILNMPTIYAQKFIDNATVKHKAENRKTLYYNNYDEIFISNSSRINFIIEYKIFYEADYEVTPETSMHPTFIKYMGCTIDVFINKIFINDDRINLIPIVTNLIEIAIQRNIQ